MKRTINVFLGNGSLQVGRIYFNAVGSRENAAFEYDSKWLSSSHAFSIDPNLPLVSGPQFHSKQSNSSIFHGAIADTGPDGWSRNVILRDHAKKRKVARECGRDPESSSLNSMDFTLAVDDISRLGALRFQDENGTFQRESQTDQRGVPPLLELSLASASIEGAGRKL